MVYLNGDWKFVDTTWDDGDPKKISYQYYLKDKQYFTGTHTPRMGNPDETKYPEIDPMNIKTQDELRIYVNRKYFYPQLTFRMADKKLKPDIRFMNFIRKSSEDYDLKYDAKKDLYTLTIRKPKD